MALGIGDQLNQLMVSFQISCYHIGALPPCHPPYHDSQHKRGQQERGGNTTVVEQCWVGRNTVEKTQSRCVATPGAHTTIFLGPQVVPQQWGKATTMGRHNGLFVAACFCFCYFYFYNCPNRVISVQHTTSQQKSTNEEQMTAGERYKSQTTARHQNRFMQTSTAQHQMIIDFGPLYLFSTAATTVVSYGYWLAVRTPRCQCGHHLIIKL